MDFNICERANQVIEEAKKKWERRIGRKIYVEIPGDKVERLERRPRLLPKEFQELLNIQLARCPKCRIPCSSSHMSEVHQIYIPCYEDIIKEIEDRFEETKRRKLSRNSSIHYIKNFVSIYLNRMKSFLDIQYT